MWTCKWCGKENAREHSQRCCHCLRGRDEVTPLHPKEGGGSKLGLEADIAFLVFNFERCLFWRPGHHGYTPNSTEAGFYSFGDAARICLEANGHGKLEEAMIPVLVPRGKVHE